MAQDEGKKSFIIYTSWYGWLKELTLEQKGIWIDWVMRYCNDLDPSIPEDPAVKMCILVTKDFLKADLEKWRMRCEINRENGKLGGRPKNQTKPNETEQNPTKPKETERFFEKPKKPDNDNDTDNDTETGIGNERYIPQPEVSDTPKKETKHKFGKYGRVLLTDEEYKRLETEWGKDVLESYIIQLDEYVESNGNKNKYKDFNLVLRRAYRENWFKKSTFSSQSQTGTTWDSAEELPPISDEEFIKLKQRHEEEERMRGSK